MAQGTIKAQVRNTIGPVRKRARNYCFTLNNYTEDDIKTIQGFKCEYVFQKEVGAKNTPHLQGLLMFSNPKDFSSVKKMLPKAHIEECRNKLASIKYCTKIETRAGDDPPYTNMKDTSKFNKNGTMAQKKVPQSYPTLEEKFEKMEQRMNEIDWSKVDMGRLWNANETLFLMKCKEEHDNNFEK